MVEKYETERYEIIIGFIPGYQPDINLSRIENIKKNNNITVINSLYRSISVKNPFVIVSAVIDETIVSYPVEWGCPYTGEPVYRITCTRNPKFNKSPEEFRSAIIYNVEELKKELKQSTVTVTESKVKMMYFTNDNESEGN